MASVAKSKETGNEIWFEFYSIVSIALIKIIISIWNGFVYVYILT